LGNRSLGKLAKTTEYHRHKVNPEKTGNRQPSRHTPAMVLPKKVEKEKKTRKNPATPWAAGFPLLLKTSILAGTLLVTNQKLPGITIKMDFRSDNGFLSNVEARAAVEKAAADLSAVITTRLRQVPLDAGKITSQQGQTSFTTTWNYFYNDPITGKTLKGFTPAIAENLIIIYAGGKSLEKHVAGKGAPGGVQIHSTGGGNPNSWRNIIVENTTKANNIFRRGGPVIQTITGTSQLGPASVDYRIETGPNIGSLWFNTDTNSDGRVDTPEQLAAFWHYSHRTAVHPRKIDLYTVALHEIMHVLGVGSSASWDRNLHNGLWGGTSARTTAGSNINLADGGHISANVKGRRIHDNLLQSAVMGPATGPGQRKLLTNIDLAILKDLGWEIIPLQNLR
jgi:hypothetical protein